MGYQLFMSWKEEWWIVPAVKQSSSHGVIGVQLRSTPNRGAKIDRGSIRSSAIRDGLYDQTQKLDDESI